MSPASKLVETLQECSEIVLAESLRGADLQAIELEGNEIFFHEGIALTVVQSELYQILFKMHFNFNAIKGLVGHRDGVQSKEDIIDYMKETCNLIAGRYKQRIYGVEQNVNHCVPVYLNGYTEQMFSSAVYGEEFTWAVGKANTKVSFSALVNINDIDQTTALYSKSAAAIAAPAITPIEEF